MTDPVFHEQTPRVLYALRGEPVRFNALARILNVRSPRMLNKLLRRLVRDGIVVRTVHRVEPPAIVEYSLSALGKELAASTIALRKFWDAHKGEITERRFIHSEVHAADAIRAADAAV